MTPAPLPRGGDTPGPVSETAEPEEASGGAWSATRALGRAILVCSAFLLVAVLTGRYDFVVLAIPFALGTVISLARRPEGVPEVDVAAIDPRFPEGGQVTAAVCVTNADRVRLDLVVVRMTTARWVRLRFGCRPYATTVGRRASVELPLRGRAVRWGRQALGPTVVYAIASDGLLLSDPLVAPELWLKVYPVIEPFRAGEAMPRAAGLVGFHRSRRPGEGGELAGVRPFAAGDRLRRIDWRVSLRERQLHVVATLSDRDAEVALLLDVLHDAGRSGGIDGESSVLDTTVRAAAGIAEHYLQRGDRVSIVGNGTPARMVRAASGRRQYLMILEWLMEVTPTGGTEASAAQDSSEMTGAVFNPHWISPNALVIVLTPLLDPRSARMVAALARGGHFVVAVDTLGTEVAQRGHGKWAELANELWRLERENLLGQLREHGVPVVAWGGTGSLDQVLQDVTRMAAAPKGVGR